MASGEKRLQEALAAEMAIRVEAVERDAEALAAGGVAGNGKPAKVGAFRTEIDVVAGWRGHIKKARARRCYFGGRRRRHGDRGGGGVVARRHDITTVPGHGPAGQPPLAKREPLQSTQTSPGGGLVSTHLTKEYAPKTPPALARLYRIEPSRGAQNMGVQKRTK
jgi:hypothetical protein